MRALLVYPTHANLHEELDRYINGDVPAAIYPMRTTIDTDHTIINCWNHDADQAEAIGLPVVRTICPLCPEQRNCRAKGYLRQIIDANEATVGLSTHKRLQHTGFEDLCRDRDYIAIHEDPIRLLRPTCSLDVQDLQVIHAYMLRLLSDPFWLDWFAESTSKDADGNVVADEHKRVRRERYLETTQQLCDLLDDLVRAVEQAQSTTPWQSPVTTAIPLGFEGFLWRSSQLCQVKFSGAPWKFLLSALSADLRQAAILVTPWHVTGMQQGTTNLQTSVLGVLENRPPKGKPFWFCDATLTQKRLASIVERTVTNATPQGDMRERKQALQYVRDITQRTSRTISLSLLRGVLAKHRHYRCVGLITHRSQLRVLEKLEPVFRERIVMSTYFGSGNERSSNAWYQQCDLILVFGTPRLPPHAVKEYLVQVGEHDVVREEPTWGDVYWYGRTVSGETQKFQGRGYHDVHWREAHRDLVRAALVQAVGRGRTVLDQGCDVLLVSNEECGLTVINEEIPRLNDLAIAVFGQLQQLTATKSNKGYLENMAVSTDMLAQSLNRSPRTVRRALTELAAFELVHRAGPRSGWLLGAPESSSPSHPRTESIHAHCH